MRIVAGQAIANRRRVDLSLDLRGIFVGVAGEAELVRSGGDQLDAGGVFVDADFVTTGAAHRNGGMDGFAFRFVFMALETFGAIRLRIERNGMYSRGNARSQEYDDGKENQGMITD